MKKILTISLGLTAVLAASSALAANEWKIRKTSWSASDEKNFENFVAAIGDSGCRSFDQCLDSPANPYRATDPGVRFASDCADLPYSLRMYFAWKNGLPFSYESSVAPNGATNDIRYSLDGNRVTGRKDLVTKTPGAFLNGIQQMNIVLDVISSASFRLNPAADDKTLFTDMYPAKLSRTGIRPGTSIYDPNGHVAVVYKVGNDGRIFFMDAHPDNSLTRGVYGKKFARSRPPQGAGFKNWRPIQLVGATQDANGNFIGGKIVAKSNAEIADYSKEQYFGTQPDPAGSWSKGRFIWKGQQVDYYDYARFALAVGDLKYNPLLEVKNMMQGLCTDLQDRVLAVNVAIARGIQNKEHPARLPSNIYGTDGEWEDYSTPSRDARLKTSFKELRDRAQEFVEKQRSRDASIVYNGSNLKADLLSVYNQEAAACSITYNRSNGQPQRLTLGDIFSRVFALSFDPYHCIELRWGAKAAELASCGDGATKRNWYDAEIYLRNQIDRKYDAKMDYTADELKRLPPGVGVQNPPDVDLKGYLTSNR